MKEKEFNLKQEREKIFKKYRLLDGCKNMILEQDQEFIKRNVGCGIKIGGGWILQLPNQLCGEFFEHEVDAEGRSLGQKYYCDRCNKLIKEAGDKFI